MDQAGDNCEFRFHQEERARVHCNLGVAAQEYMLFCGCLEDAGYSNLCTYFWLYLSSEYVDGRYPYLIVDHPHFCENMESSVFYSVGRLLYYRVPVNSKDVLLSGAWVLSWSGLAGGDRGLGLSQGGPSPPFFMC